MKQVIRGLVYLICGLFLAGCYNNAHLRTAQPLEDGERANSISVVSAIGGPAPGNEQYSGISGLRVESSFIKGNGKGDVGVYLGAGIAGSDGICYILRYDRSKYTRLNNKIPCKLGMQGEVDIASGTVNGIGVQLRPFLTSMVSDTKPGYYGIHALLSYGHIEERDLYYYGESYKYKLTSVGVGFTVGMERIYRVTSFQYQYDISLTRSYLAGGNHGDTNLMLSVSLGLNSFNKPEKVKRQARQNIQTGIEKRENGNEHYFDPETGEPIEEINRNQKSQQFDPETGLPVEQNKSEKLPVFDPDTGLLIQDEEKSTESDDKSK